MEEAARKTGDQPGSVAWGARWATDEGISDWAGLGFGAGDEELNLEQEYDAELPQAAPTGDWGPSPQQAMDAGTAEAGVEAGGLDDEAAAITADDEEPPFEDEAAEGDGEPLAQVWAPRPDREPFFEHALYVEAMHALAAGKGAVVASSLRELAELYPEEPAIHDLLVRMELKSAVAQERALPKDRRQAAPALQSALTLLLLVTVGLVGIAGFYVAYKNVVEPVAVTNRIAADIRAREAEIERRLAAGDWNGVLPELQELEDMQGPSDWIAETRAYAERQKQLGDWYADALSMEQAGDLAGAVALLQQIDVQEPGYRDVAYRSQSLQTLQALEMDWLEAEGRVQAEDWEAATTLLLDIRRRAPEFRDEQVKERLFQIYELLARQSLSQAGGSPEHLRQALVYLNGALAERPTNRDLVRQRTLALGYLRGSDALERGDWLEAAEQWEAIYAQQRDYQGGVLEARLREAYPRAARQAITEAGGSIERLERAALYLDRALASSPEEEGLRHDREMVSAYLEGAEAFEAGYWTQAIRRWGPLYAVQPGYQNGALERNLKQACGASPDSDLMLCPP